MSDPVASLEAIRATVHRWLDLIEQRLDDGDRSPSSSRERELDQQREALRAEVEHREREWADRLEALEHDRRLLAEAWERLERAQVAADPMAPARAAPEPAPVAPSLRAALPKNEPANPVDQAVLRQFETLRRDVRRKSEAQRLP